MRRNRAIKRLGIASHHFVPCCAADAPKMHARKPAANPTGNCGARTANARERLSIARLAIPSFVESDIGTTHPVIERNHDSAAAIL
jgi:hypothetical protein